MIYSSITTSIVISLLWKRKKQNYALLVILVFAIFGASFLFAMNVNTLTLWGNGSVTLPKRWRDQYPTKVFLAEETSDGYLLIKPVVPIEYYERDNGSFGLHFPTGMEAGELLRRMREADKKIHGEKKTTKRVRRHSP